MCLGHTIGKPLLLFSATFSPPEMAQKVPAYSICWDKSELQKEYFFGRKVMGFAKVFGLVNAVMADEIT